MFGNAERNATIRELAKAPLFRDSTHMIQFVVPDTLSSLLFCSLIYVMSFNFVHLLVPQGSLSNPLKRRKLCYGITNFVVNLVLGVAGFYYNSLLNEDPTPQEIIQLGELHFFGSWQLGYQLWAIPVGIFFVKEDPLMLLHHVAVIMAASTIALFTNGMRYWAPFVLGCVEISSVPLAVMNVFKDNKELIAKYPDAYLMVRTASAICFLYVRVFMFVPRNSMQMYDHVMAWSNNENTIYKIYSFLVFFSSLFLTFLQLKWGHLIVKGFVKTYSGIIFGDVEKISKDKIS